MERRTRDPPMAEEASGEPESPAEPNTSEERQQLQESYESPPPRRDESVRQARESAEDLG